MTGPDEHNYIEVARREKRAQLATLGQRPYAYRYDRSHAAQDALALYRDEMGEDGPARSGAALSPRDRVRHSRGSVHDRVARCNSRTSRHL